MKLRSSAGIACALLGTLSACDDPGVVGFGGAASSSTGTGTTSSGASTASSGQSSGSGGSGGATTSASSASTTSSGSSGSTTATSSSSGGCTPIDDGVACTTDACVNGQPTNVPDDAACDPGEACDPTAGPTGCVAFDACPPALDALDGGSVDGDTSSAVNDFAPSCANGAGMHPDLAYTLTLAADSDVLLEVDPAGNQAVSVMLLPVDANACGAELLCAAPPSGNATLEVKNLAAGTYAIVVDGTGAATQSGAFTLTVLTQASTIGAGDLVINEIMADGGPGSGINSTGEWVEIANPGAIAIATAGLVLGDGTATTSAVKPAVGPQFIVPPGGYLLGMNSLTPASNGGIANGDFKIAFSVNNNAGDVFRLAKGAQNVIDVVDTTMANPNGSFPAIGADGVSLQLDVAKKSATLNDNKVNWCNTPTAMFGNLGAKGTPRTQNQACSAPACTVATQAVDCNDANPLTQDLCIAGTCQHI